MEGRLALVVTRSENLDEVGLTTASAPAGAFAVLAGAGDLAVESPDGGHVAVETSVTVEGHLEAEEEDLVGAGEALVGDVLGTGETASLVAGLAGPDGELLVTLDDAGLEDLGLGAAAGTFGVQVRERAALSAVSLSEWFALPESRSLRQMVNLRIKDTRALATVIAEEDHVVSNTILGVVVSDTVPVLAGAADLVLEVGNRALGGLVLGRLGRLVAGGLGRLGLGGGSSSRGGVDWGRGIGGSGSAAEPVVLPRDDLAVNGGDDHVGLSRALVLALRVEVSVAVAAGVNVRRRLLDVALLRR